VEVTVKKLRKLVMFTFYTSNSRCASVGDKKNKFHNWVVLRLSSEHTEYANSWRDVIGRSTLQKRLFH